MEFILAFVVVAVIFAVIDAVWLKLSSSFYKKELGSLLLKVPNFSAAVAFYILYVIGVVAFVVEPALRQVSVLAAMGYGALFGLVAYATYDLTNLATLQQWSKRVVAVDMVWGVFVTSTAATAAYLILTEWLSL